MSCTASETCLAEFPTKLQETVDVLRDLLDNVDPGNKVRVILFDKLHLASPPFSWHLVRFEPQISPNAAIKFHRFPFLVI